MPKPFRLKAPRVAEHDLQMQVAKALRILLEPHVFWSSIDHAAAASAIVGANRKARGVRAGLPDIFLVHEGRFYGVELKAEGGYRSAGQIDLHVELTLAGGEICVCRSVGEVLDALRGWGIPTREVERTAA